MGKSMTQHGLFLIDSKRPHPYKRLGLRFLDISIMGILYLLGGVLFSTFMNRIFPEFDKEVYDRQPLYIIILELMSHAALIMCAAFILRQMVSVLTFPFDGWWGYKHSRVAEIRGGVIVSFAVLVMLLNFDQKLIYTINDRLNINLRNKY